MRLFIAVRLNEKMENALLDMQDAMKWKGVRGNYTRPENLHLTLAFIGEYPDPCQVKEVIESAAFEPFTIRLDGAGSFRGLWWAGVSAEAAGGGDPLRKLVKRIRHALADEGIPFDRKKFSPHIT
ncbi:MAG: RNA 2',3'-cyclic phosphodiesterase, partial [Lachnospiraceae bacterium]|nr:RNA 2',3'-cyclic phosphodiesterase [Lachnospiraceae bacterium]